MTQKERRIFLINYLLSEYEGEDKIPLDSASFGSDSEQNLVSNRRLRQIPDDENEQRVLLRGLMNVREPKPIGEDFLKVQDEYLSERKKEKGIVKLEEILKQVQNDTIHYSPLTIHSPKGDISLLTINSPKAILWQGDITTLEVAVKNGCKSIAFCCTSTGVFMFPRVRAAEIAIETCREFLDENPNAIKVVFNVFLDEDRMIYERLPERN